MKDLPFLSRHLKERLFSRQQGSFARVTLKVANISLIISINVIIIILLSESLWTFRVWWWRSTFRRVWKLDGIIQQFFVDWFIWQYIEDLSNFQNCILMPACKTQVTGHQHHIKRSRFCGFNLSLWFTFGISPAALCLLLQVLPCGICWTFSFLAGAILETHSRSAKYYHQFKLLSPVSPSPSLDIWPQKSLNTEGLIFKIWKILILACCTLVGKYLSQLQVHKDVLGSTWC